MEDVNVKWMWIISSIYMSLMFMISYPLKNAGMVDFAWPSTFTTLAIYLIATGSGWNVRMYLLGGMYIFCGARFIFGWIMRTLAHGEDKRWQLWRDTWAKGDFLMNPFGLRNEKLNLFLFYHAQSTCTALCMIIPLVLACRNPITQLSMIEYAAVALWILSFGFENVADMQLVAFKKSKANRGKVCMTGLWAYTRHPNYFGEFGIWVAYSIFGYASAQTDLDLAILIASPIVAYGFLVYFTVRTLLK